MELWAACASVDFETFVKERFPEDVHRDSSGPYMVLSWDRTLFWISEPKTNFEDTLQEVDQLQHNFKGDPVPSFHIFRFEAQDPQKVLLSACRMHIRSEASHYCEPLVVRILDVVVKPGNNNKKTTKKKRVEGLSYYIAEVEPAMRRHINNGGRGVHIHREDLDLMVKLIDSLRDDKP